MFERASSAPRNSERLRERRKRGRRTTLVVFCVLLLILLGLADWGLWQPQVRIAQITVVGADPALASYATSAMQGSYYGLIPRDSTFFLPERAIRAAILAEHPDLAALSLRRDGFTELTINTNERVPIGRWCGLAPTSGVTPYCYLFDANGYVYAALPDSTDPAASTTPPVQTVNPFILYAPLEGDAQEPLRGTIANSDNLPSLFDFARELSPLGSPVEAIVVQEGEVDDLLASGTRITYVFGHEQEAFTALVSAKANFNLTDGSVDYVDLRFAGKVYVKKVDGSVQ